MLLQCKLIAFILEWNTTLFLISTYFIYALTVNKYQTTMQKYGKIKQLNYLCKEFNYIILR